MGGLASAIQTAEIASRSGVQAGIIGGYQSDSNFVGGLGAIYEMEFALAKNFSISVDGGGGYNAVDGPLAGGGLDFKYRFLKIKQFDVSAIGYGRGFYQFSPQSPSYYLYGGGAVLLATMKTRYATLTVGGGASDDLFGDTDNDLSNQIGPVGMVSASYPLSKTSDIGLAFEYGGDRFFLGAYFDFAIQQDASKENSKAAQKKK
jgi:hypothetical protein